MLGTLLDTLPPVVVIRAEALRRGSLHLLQARSLACHESRSRRRCGVDLEVLIRNPDPRGGLRHSRGGIGETFITVKEFEAPLPGRGDEGRQPPPGAVEQCCCLAYLPLRPTDKVAATPSSPRRPLFSWKVEDGSFTTMFTHSQNCRRELSTQQGSDVALDGLEARVNFSSCLQTQRRRVASSCEGSRRRWII